MSAATIIACVHATPLAIAPVADAFRRWAPAWHHHDIIEGQLLGAGGEGIEAVSLFQQTLGRADAMEPAAILTTCSLYTRYLPLLRMQMERPVLGIDEPMIERALEVGGRIGLVGSIPLAMETTARLIRERAAAAEFGAPDLSARLLVDVNLCTTPAGVRQLADGIRLMLPAVDAVVVVQASLSPVMDLLAPEEQHRVLTSPRLAVDRLREMLKS
jgi:Asp/Glu/hydantoin racemase